MKNTSLFRAIATILVVLFTAYHSLAQTPCPGFEYALGLGVFATSTSVQPRGITIDAQGNKYVFGTLTGTAQFGSTTLVGTSEFFVAKLSPAGQWLWAVLAGNRGSTNIPGGIGVDAQGNCYISGTFLANSSFYPATFGSNITLLSTGNAPDVFVAKLDSSGQWLWAVKGGSADYDYARGIAVDAQGNSYVTGRYTGTAFFGSSNITSSGYGDVFVAKIDSTGQWKWAASAGSAGAYDEVYTIGADAQGNSYISGDFKGTVTFGSVSATAPGTQKDLYVAKLDASGVWVWATKAGSTILDDAGKGIAVDAQGNCYVTGYCGDNTVFGSSTVRTNNLQTIFVAKINSAGQWLFGTVEQNNLTQAASANYSIAIDPQGNSYVASEFLGTSTIGISTLTTPFIDVVNNIQDKDVFVAKLDGTGQWLWAVQGGSHVHDDIANAIAVDAQGNSYVTGTAIDTGFFGAITLEETVSFVAKVSVKVPSLSTIPNSTIICGDSVQLAANILGFSQLTWTPSTALSNCTIKNPKAAPTQTTTYTLTASDLCGNNATKSTTVTVNPYSVSTSATVSNIVCGNSSTLTATGAGTSTPTYNWSPTDGLNNAGIKSPVANPTVTTTYTVLATTANGCMANSTVTLTVNPYTLTATATPTNIACGASTVLNSTPSAGTTSLNYQWSPTYRLSSTNIANPTATPGTSTTYTVVASTANGCYVIDSVTVVVSNPNPPMPVITSASGSFGLCNGGTQLDAGTGFAGYTWTTGETTQTITVLTPGTYTVTVDDQGGCAGSTQVTVTPLVEINAPDGTLLCAGQSSTIQLNADGGFDSYTWSNGEQTQGIQINTPGLYTVTVTNATCTGSAEVLVTQNNGQATADFSYAGNGGQDVTFTAIGNGINFLSWDFGDGGTSTDPIPTHTYTANGTYTVEVTITDICGQTASKAKSITVPVVTGVGSVDATMVTWSIYPNPTNGRVSIEATGIPEGCSIEVWNQVGERLTLIPIRNHVVSSVDLANFSAGIYLVKLSANNTYWTKKIVKY